MAESQVPFHYDEASLAAIRGALSDPRFGTYLVAAGQDNELAVQLYLYNARLAKSFLYLLQMAEVSLRNGMDTLFVALHGAQWPHANGFRDLLTEESLASLDTAIRRASAKKGDKVTRHDIVATLTFDFWSNLFRDEYDRTFWQTNLRTLFPHLPEGHTRPSVQRLVRTINGLRNRIAHHEPILSVNATSLATDIISLAAMRDPVTAGWMRHHSTVASVIRGKPAKNAPMHRTVGDRCDTRMHLVAVTDTITAVLGAYDPNVPSIVCTDQAGAPVGVFQVGEVSLFLHQRAEAQGHLVDLSELTVGDLIDAGHGVGTWRAMQAGAPLVSAIDELKKPGVRAVVTVDAGGAASGVILRAHRRY